MTRFLRRVVVLCFLAFAAKEELLFAQAPIAGVPGYNPILYGLPVNCLDSGGAPVAFSFGVINDIAKSSMGPSGPIMVFSPAANTAPAPLLLFIYAHECGHHALGHIRLFVQGLTPPPTYEMDADCFASKTVRNQGLLNLQQIQFVASTFQNNPPMGPYPAGPVRAQNIVNCFLQP